MARVTRRYTLPLVGRMVNWRTASGDPADPIRPGAIGEFGKTFNFGAMPQEEQGRRVTMLDMDLEAGTCLVEITAPDTFLDAFEVWLSTRTITQMAENSGRTHLKRGRDDPEPEVSFGGRS